MLNDNQIKLNIDDYRVEEIDDWTFNGASTRELTHCYHDYPARMIPQIASKLLDRFGKNANLLFDPYCGTGTSLVEALTQGINAIGTDLNPLARLVAQAKTSNPGPRKLDKYLRVFYKFLLDSNVSDYSELPSKIDSIARPEFWFKPQVISKLYYIQKFINNIEDQNVQLFFRVAFSETVRESSNTRNGEFKLYRYNIEKLKTFDPDVFRIMCTKLQRNRTGLKSFLDLIKKNKRQAKAKIFGFDSVHPIPKKYINPSSVDIVITSPPYGDSHTTVAYGQYSRLSASWLALPDPEKTDRVLMGGKIRKEIPSFPSNNLNRALANIERKDQKRAFEVSSFYIDLRDSIDNISELIRPHGYSCYVVGNRKVKGITLPTDDAVKCFFESNHFRHVDTYIRLIPNKRMPLKNSPTNIAGILDSTMINEFIVVMQKQ